MAPILVRYKGQSASIDIDETTTVDVLRERLAEQFNIDSETLKVLAGGKSITNDTDGEGLVLEQLKFTGGKAMLLGTPRPEIDSMRETETSWAKEEQRRADANLTLGRRARKPVSTVKPLDYTFSELEVLPYGDTDGALRVLERIRDDKAVQALMAKYKLKVGKLAELDPATNTDHQTRRLGLNENAGQVIRLRIRTDFYEGFVNYNEVLMVLCHELAHNSHGEHNAEFWKVCRLYEKEIKELNPWRGKGQRLDGL